MCGATAHSRSGLVVELGHLLAHVLESVVVGLVLGRGRARLQLLRVGRLGGGRAGLGRGAGQGLNNNIMNWEKNNKVTKWENNNNMNWKKKNNIMIWGKNNKIMNWGTKMS